LCLGENLCGHLNFLNQCLALFSKVSMELLLRSCKQIKTWKLQVYFTKNLELLTHHSIVQGAQNLTILYTISTL
jgi:hypothetical protein